MQTLKEASGVVFPKTRGVPHHFPGFLDEAVIDKGTQ